MRLNRFLSAACGAGALALGVAALPSAAAASSSSAPVIHESFTLLACPKKPSTTVQIEGCAEHKVVALDKSIDALNAKIFTKLGKAGRTSFVSASGAWVQYRNDTCSAEASIYAGGTIQPVAYANCLVSLDGSHVTDLKATLTALSPAG
jgi:uncharacterized protein YecT (DUF1311 family)